MRFDEAVGSDRAESEEIPTFTSSLPSLLDGKYPKPALPHFSMQLGLNSIRESSITCLLASFDPIL
jgi:hypothetical protein